MLRISVRTFLIVLFLLLLVDANSQDSVSADSIDVEEEVVMEYDNLTEEVVADSLPVKERSLDNDKLEKLKKDKDFDYSEAPTVGESLWERFWRWIGEWIG